MPIQAPNWTEFLICPICTKEFGENRLPISLGCSHTICKTCLGTLHRTQCPFDQTCITIDINALPINYALLQLVSSPPLAVERETNLKIAKNLTPDEFAAYETATHCIENLAMLLKPNGNVSGNLLSRPMQRKLVSLISCQLFDNEGRTRSLRAVRSLGERVVTELILQHQNPQQLSQNLWAAVRARGCQFLGPAMQEEVLKLVLLALEDGCDLSRKILVLYVVQKLKTTFPQASKTSIGHVVQLLYRASCFKVSKRESDSSLMTLKEEFRTYDSLRREHDTQIVQIATEAGLRIAPDQWSALLYGDSNHKSHMQSIIDKQQNPSSFSMSVNELVMALQRTGDPADLGRLRSQMDKLALIDASVDSNIVPTWEECCSALKAVKSVVHGLIDFIQNHGNRKMPETSHLIHTSRYKVSFCREFKTRGHCARGNNCNFAHSEQELEKFRTKYKKNASTIHNGSNSYANGGPNAAKVNINSHHHHHHHQQQQQHSSFNKGHDNGHGGASTSGTHQSQRFNKPMPYRSENSLYNSPMTPHHLKPTSVFSNASSSTSTPNLSVQQLSPNQQKANLNGASRFAFNGSSGNGGNNNYMPSSDQTKNMSLLSSAKGFMGYIRPPLSAPPITHQLNSYTKSPPDYGKKLLSPYGNVPINSSLNQQKHPNTNLAHPPPMSPYKNDNSHSSGYYPVVQPSAEPYFAYNNSRNSCGSADFASSSPFNEPKYAFWKQHQQQQRQKSPINMLPKNLTSHNMTPGDHFKRSTNTNRLPVQMSQSTAMFQQQQQQHASLKDGDETDGNMWPQLTPGLKSSAFSFTPVTSTNAISNMSKDKFTRSDSILTANTDDSFDNLPNPNGRYGAIGIKNTETVEWSGLQQTIANRLDNSFDIAAGDTFKSSNVMSSIECSSSSSNGGGGDLSTAQNTLNGNFLNMQIGGTVNANQTTNSSSLWSSDTATADKWHQSKEFDSFGNDSIALNLWEIMND